MKCRTLFAVAVVVAVTFWAGRAHAQSGQGVLMRALDEPFSVELADVPITEALKAVSEKTGLNIKLEDNVLECLPHGEETRLRIKARNVRLRDALTAMLDPVSLEWRPEGKSVIVSPSPELERIGRRPTFTEVGVLAKLDCATLAKGPAAPDQLREITGIAELALAWQTGDDTEKAKALAAADGHLPCTGKEYLDWICHGRDWTWYLWGPELIITTKQVQTERQLNRRIVVRYQNQPLLNVLADLAHKAGLRLTMDPGVLNLVNDETRKNFTLLMADGTVAEAFQAISGATGLTFTPAALTVRVGAPVNVPTTQPQAAPRQRASYLLTMEVTDKDGRKYTLMFRPDDLPDEFDEHIEGLKAEQVKRIRAEYSPATQPATAPTR
jgi:hypothetical protein